MYKCGKVIVLLQVKHMTMSRYV